MLDVIDVARFIVNYSNDKDYVITNLRLQKLLYFVQAYYLCFTSEKEPCFKDEIEAWDFGPVVPAVYREFKIYGSGSIPKINYYISFDSQDEWNAKREQLDENKIPKDDRDIIASVVDQFSSYSTTDLVSLTHRQQPWKNAYARSINRVISKDSIKEYFGDGQR